MERMCLTFGRDRLPTANDPDLRPEVKISPWYKEEQSSFINLKGKNYQGRKETCPSHLCHQRRGPDCAPRRLLCWVNEQVGVEPQFYRYDLIFIDIMYGNTHGPTYRHLKGKLDQFEALSSLQGRIQAWHGHDEGRRSFVWSLHWCFWANL